MELPDIPYTIYAEGTPNPDSIKFVANKLLIENGATAQYNSIAETRKAPFAQKLFEFPFVKQVFISSNFISITKHGYISWDDTLNETRGFITEYLNSKQPIILELPQQEVPIDNTFTETKTVYTEHAVPKNEVEAKIIMPVSY